MKVNKLGSVGAIACIVLSCVLVVCGLKIVDLTHALHKKTADSAGLCLWMVYDMRGENLSEKIRNRHLVIVHSNLDRLEYLCADDEPCVAELLRKSAMLDAVSCALEIASTNNMATINPRG